MNSFSARMGSISTSTVNWQTVERFVLQSHICPNPSWSCPKSLLRFQEIYFRASSLPCCIQFWFCMLIVCLFVPVRTFYRSLFIKEIQTIFVYLLILHLILLDFSSFWRLLLIIGKMRDWRINSIALYQNRSKVSAIAFGLE